MAKAQKRGNKEVRKPKKVQPKPAVALAVDKNAVKLTLGKGS
jgi:hypothetical protein